MTHIQRKLLVTLGIVVVTGCGSVQKQWKELEATAPAAIAETPQEALADSEAQELKNGKKRNVILNGSDAVVKLHGEPSYYELFRFTAGSELKYLITIESRVVEAPTLDNEKESSIVVPLVILMDESGNVIRDKHTRLEFKNTFWNGMRYELEWQGFLPEAGTYYIVLAADNREVGKIIRDGEVQGYSAGFYYSPSYKWQVMVGPHGKMRIKLELKEF